jgi:hypothetical protein
MTPFLKAPDMVAPGVTEQQWRCVALLVDVLLAA